MALSSFSALNESVSKAIEERKKNIGDPVGGIGQSLINALLGAAAAYLTGGAGAALSTQLMGGGAASVAGALAPSAANVLPALETGIAGLTGKAGSTPEEAGQYGMAQGLSQVTAPIKQKFAESLMQKQLSQKLPGLEPSEVEIGGVKYRRPLSISGKLKAPTDLSEAGQIAYRGVKALNDAGRTEEAIEKLDAVTDVSEAEKTFISSKIQRKWKPTGRSTAAKSAKKPKLSID